jgi:hypothetical protein
MGLWCVSMLEAAELLWVLRALRLSPSTMVALAQGLVQVNCLALVRAHLGPAMRRANFSLGLRSSPANHLSLLSGRDLRSATSPAAFLPAKAIADIWPAFASPLARSRAVVAAKRAALSSSKFIRLISLHIVVQHEFRIVLLRTAFDRKSRRPEPQVTRSGAGLFRYNQIRRRRDTHQHTARGLPRMGSSRQA